MDISVVVPIYRNEKTLRELNDRIMRQLATFAFEIIYVNDASPDAALGVLKILSAEHREVSVVDLSRNVGQHKATLEGLKKAAGEKVVVMDGDLQDAPELIIELYQLAVDRETSVFVIRAGEYQSRSRMITSRIIKYVMYLLSDLHYKAGSYYLVDRSTLHRVIDVASRCQYPYISIIVAHFTGNLRYIPAQRVKSFGKSGYSFFGRLNAAFKAVYCSLYCSYVKLRPS